MDSTDEVHSDIDTTCLDALPITQPHCIVEVILVETNLQCKLADLLCPASASMVSCVGFEKTYIILPGTIYGIASEPLDCRIRTHSRSLNLSRTVCTNGKVGSLDKTRTYVNVQYTLAMRIFLTAFISCGLFYPYTQEAPAS